MLRRPVRFQAGVVLVLSATMSGGGSRHAAAGIFISYRRQEASHSAGRLHDHLARRFGESRVFLDIDWIKPGVDFMRVITEAIARSDFLLVIIGPQWLARDRDGRRRLDKPDDPVRVEIESALHHGIRVIPLLVDGAVMPRVEDLPDGVARITRLTALRVDHETFRTDVGRLVETIDEELGTVPSPASDRAETVVSSYPPPRPTEISDWAAPIDVQRDEDQLARLRRRVLNDYTEYLNQSVEHDNILKLQLGLDWLPEKTFRPQDDIFAVPQRRDAERLPAGTSLLQAFDRAAGLDGDGLLVVGRAGAGKTTLLVELARGLAERAQVDPRHPVPVYLPLSTWATRHAPLDRWLVDQLGELHQVPRALGRRWINDGQLLFVLDGLDEIPDPDGRAACVKAINQFNRFGRSYRLPTMVGSRSVEYDTLPVRLQLETAIGVRPLNPSVVVSYLQQAGPSMQGVAAAIQRDPELLKLLQSPLLISMLTLAYAGLTDLPSSGTPEQLRQRLFHDYVCRRLSRPADEHGEPKEGRHADANRQRTVHWLGALAHNLNRHNQTVFLLERMQPDWLPIRRPRAIAFGFGLFPGLCYGLGLGLFLGLFGLVSELRLGLIEGLRTGLLMVLIGLVVGLSLGLINGLIQGGSAVQGAPFVIRLQPTERLTWSWKRTLSRWRRVSRVKLFVYGSFTAFVVWGSVDSGAPGLALITLAIWVVVGVLGLAAGLESGEMAQSIQPGEGIRRSLRHGLWMWGAGAILGSIVGLLLGLVVGLVDGWVDADNPGLTDPPLSTRVLEGLSLGVGFGLISGLILGQFFGLGAVLRYSFLRILLWRYQVAPLRYVRWLEEMVRARLLYRVGGGYEFIHGLLRNYFEEHVAPGSSESPHRMTNAPSRWRWRSDVPSLRDGGT